MSTQLASADPSTSAAGERRSDVAPRKQTQAVDAALWNFAGRLIASDSSSDATEDWTPRPSPPVALARGVETAAVPVDASAPIPLPATADDAENCAEAAISATPPKTSYFSALRRISAGESASSPSEAPVDAAHTGIRPLPSIGRLKARKLEAPADPAAAIVNQAELTTSIVPLEIVIQQENVATAAEPTSEIGPASDAASIDEEFAQFEPLTELAEDEIPGDHQSSADEVGESAKSDTTESSLGSVPPATPANAQPIVLRERAGFSLLRRVRQADAYPTGAASPVITQIDLPSETAAAAEEPAKLLLQTISARETSDAESPAQVEFAVSIQAPPATELQSTRKTLEAPSSRPANELRPRLSARRNPPEDRAASPRVGLSLLGWAGMVVGLIGLVLTLLAFPGWI